MAELRIYGREIHTAFDLLGSKEDDITYSLGWAMANSDHFIQAILKELTNQDVGEVVRVDLQQAIRDGGRTDIEIITTQFHVIFEAKLQSIRHVDRAIVSNEPWNRIRSLKGRTDWPEEPHMSYELGARIVPSHDVRSTAIRNRRGWAPIDLLLTSETIPEAVERGKAREAAVGAA